MPAFPTESELFPTGDLAPATAKARFLQWLQAVTGLLGTTGNVPDARSALGVGLAPCVRGLKGNVNATTPLTKFDLSADMVVLREANGGTVTRYNTGTHTVDLNQVGPVAAGRDQAGAFPANSWVHLYWVWNGTVLGVVASLALPSVGPTLPPGCTHWVYATTIRWNASSNIIPCSSNGASVYYRVDDAGANRVLNAGVATSMTTVDCSSLVPPNFVVGNFKFTVYAVHTASAGFGLFVRPTGSGLSGQSVADCWTQLAGVGNNSTNWTEYPLNSSRQIDYKITTVPATNGGAYIDVMGYRVANGDA